MPDDQAPVWPQGSGEMAERIRAHDWSQTPLGPISVWSSRLKLMVELVLANPQVSSLVCGPERRLLYNDAAARLYGTRHPAALGRPLPKVFPEGWSTVAPLYERAFAGETVQVDAQSLDTRGEGEVDDVFEAILTPVRDEDGRVAFVHMVGKEFGKEFGAANAARESEALLRMAMSGARMGTWRWDLANQLVWGDAQFLKLWGFPPSDEAHPLSLFTDRMSVEGAAEMQAIVTKAIEANEEFDGPLEIVAGPTAGHWIRWRGRADANDPSILFGVTFDVTDQRRADQALRESNARHSLLIESLAQAVWETDSEGVVVADSPSWRAYTGQTLEEWLGYGWLNAIHPDDQAYAERQWREATSARRLVDAEFRLRAPDGGWHWTNVRAAPVLDANGNTEKWVGMNIDIDARKRANAALRESEERKAFLLKFSDALRAERTADAMGMLGIKLLADHLSLDRCYIVSRRNGGNLWDVGPEVRTPGLPAMPHVLDQNGFPQALRLISGQTMVIDDTAARTDFTETEKQGLLALGFGGLLMPTLRMGAGNPAWSMVASSTRPRQWTPSEIHLFEEVNERTWAAIERGRAEAALRESEARLRGFGEASTDVLWIRDAETLNWTYLTPAFEAIYGMPRDEALAGNNFRNWVDLILPEDRHHAVDMIGRVRHGENVTFEYRVRRPKDGAIRWLRNTDFPIRDVEGRITAIGGVGHDASQEKEADRIIRASRRQLRTLIEGVPNLVWRGVDGGDWTWSSPQWTAFTGLTEQASIGRGWLAAIHPDDQGNALDAWRDAEATGAPLAVEYRIRQADGDSYRWFQTRALPVCDEDNGAILEWLGTSTDIDDLRQLQESQAVMVAELQHRTRNLIGVVGSVARSIASSSASLDDFRPRFTERLETLSRVQGLLSQAGEERITIREVVELELKALGAAALGDRVTVEGPDVSLRKSIVQTLALAIHELATNARKYGALANDQGKLAVRWTTSRVEHEDRRLILEWTERGVEVKFANGAAVVQGGGYGRQLIEKSLPYSLKAKTTYDLGPDGLHCTIDMPLGKIQRRSRP